MLIGLGLAQFAYSQRNEMPDKSDYYSFGVNFYSSAYSFPSESPDSMNIVILYRIRYAGLNFVKNTINPSKGHFFATLSTEATLRDAEGIIRRRLIGADSVYVNSYEETNTKNEFIVNYLTATLPNQTFKASINVYDKNTQKFQKVDYTLEAIKPTTRLGVSQPLFAAQYGPGYSPYIFNNDLPFQYEPTSIIILADGSGKYDNIHYAIFPVNPSDKKAAPVAKGEFVAVSGNEPVISIDSRNKITLLFNLNPKMADRVYAFAADFDYRKLKEGKYSLNIWKQGRSDTLKDEFSVVWENRPLSIKNIPYAIDLMRYIMKDEEHDKLNEGDDEEKEQKLFAYWKKRDPTPDTEYNEAMAEFFRRADYAHFNYQTLTEQDGAKTDRGRVYIHYGPPEEITSNLVNGRTHETWLYRKLNKEFSFETVSIGVVRLSEIKQ